MKHYFWKQRRVGGNVCFQKDDKAIMRAYGLIKVVDGQETWLSETVAILFEMYEEIRPKLGLFFV